MDQSKRSAVFHTRITPELKKQIQADCKSKHLSMTVWTQLALELAVRVSGAEHGDGESGFGRERAA